MSGGAGPFFSDAWFELFLHRVPAEVTAREVAFVSKWLPRASGRVLDVCCGAGRHAAQLARAGPAVTGVDRSLAVLRASDNAGFARVAADARALPFGEAVFDTVICMWASFGWFDDATNRSELEDLAGALRPGGRLILDVYNRTFFEQHAGARERDVEGHRIIDRKWMEGERLFTVIEYGDGRDDRFDWRVYRPGELVALAGGVGLSPLAVCSGFDESTAPSDGSPRMQLVFEKRLNSERAEE